MRRDAGVRRALVPLPWAVALSLLAGCTSPARVADGVAEQSGVITVRVTENGGDDALPFTRIPVSVRVEMGGDATSDEVMAVFDAYGDDIDDGDVTLVEVVLAGSKTATLASGENVHVTREAVDDLVEAQHDAGVIGYRRDAYPVSPSVDLVLASGGFAEVVAVADGYRDADALESVTVTAGDFLLIRDQANENLRITSARERLVRRVEARFTLTGAVVAGRGPLELDVAPADEEAVERLAARNPEASVVRTVVVS